MTPMATLYPEVAPETLWPANAAYMARTDLGQTRMLGYTPFNLDNATTLLLGILGNRPTVRHRCGVTDEILIFLKESGLSISEDIRIYDTGDEAEDIADTLVAAGRSLFWPYPLRAGRFRDDAHLVSPELWARLNSKSNLADLVPSHALAPRRTLATSDLDGRIELPVYLKAGGDAATGWGYAVHYCGSEEDIGAARTDFLSKGVESIVAENALSVDCCWCANLAITAEGPVYLGAAEQVFAAPARQLGSIIDPENPFPEAGIELALSVGEAARAAGFLGVCGMDIGRTTDGQLVVFDPNFRINACTTQILLHPSAAARSDLGLSLSFSGKTAISVRSLLEAIRGPVADGWFVPTRILDGSLLPAAEGISHCTGFVLADSRAEAEARSQLLQSLLEGARG